MSAPTNAARPSGVAMSAGIDSQGPISDNVFAAGTRRQAVERLIQDHAALFRDPMGAPLPEDPTVLGALARLMEDRGRSDAARRLREAAGSR